MTTERPQVIERLADLLVFAPVGFLLQAPRLLPELAEAGRQSLGNLRGLGGFRRGACRARQRSTPSTPSADPRPDADAATVDAARDVLVDPEREVVIVVEREDDPPVVDLPIPGYDQLAASQVIARLPGLGVRDLDRIEAHEQAHRRRRTVLAKISQLRRA